MNILGISAFYHDSAACLVIDGKIIAAAQEERFTRIKHDPSFPKHAVDFCLRYAGLTIEQVDYVAFYEKPFLKFERLLENYLAFAPRGLRSFMKAMPVWMKQKLWMKEYIRRELQYDGPIIFPEHHESHAASAFYPSPFEEAAILTLDGVGEWATTSYGIGRGNKLELLSEIHYPHSLGLLYSAFTYYCGFRVNSGEYKLMGLAPYGEPLYVDKIRDYLVDIKDDGSFRLNMDYFNYGAGLTMTSDKFHRLFGEQPRAVDSDVTGFYMDIARSVQEVTEEIYLKIAHRVKKETGMKHLCLAGGVALNCVANGKLLRKNWFDKIWIQPAAGDAGGALGAALLAWHQYLENPRTIDAERDSMEGSYLGPGFSDNEIADFLDREGVKYSKLSDEDLPAVVANLINDEKVIGWMQGRMEFGPRALGGRSIIGDARSRDMQRTMNLKIKYRESFRPFAPAVKREDVSDYFELDADSPYMLLVAPVREERRRKLDEEEEALTGIDKLNTVRSDIPAVTHVDYSARIQTVDGNTHQRFYRVLDELKQRHGASLCVNTSFNVRGEPIVCTPQDAFNCFINTEMDYLVMGNYLVDKKDMPGRKAKPQISEDISEPNPLWEELKNISSTKKDIRNFGLTVGAILLLIAAYLFWRERPVYLYIGGVGAFLVLTGLLVPFILKPLQKIWMGFAVVMGFVMSHVILFVVFYLILTPIALIAWVSGKSFLDLKRDSNTNSYWLRRAKEERPLKDYEKQY